MDLGLLCCDLAREGSILAREESILAREGLIPVRFGWWSGRREGAAQGISRRKKQPALFVVVGWEQAFSP